MKDKFIKAYTENITRPGADKLLAWIESSDFFTAPASTRFHLSSPGGLLEHIPDWWNGAFAQAPVVEKGWLKLLDVPGLGIRFDHDYIQKYQYLG